MKISKLILGLTYRCQCRCLHCSAGNYPVKSDRELSTDELKNLLDEAAHLGARCINMFGGEATLRKDLDGLIEHAAARVPEITLDSNGQNISGKFAERLKSAGLRLMYLSLDGSAAGTHDGFQRRKGSFDRVLKSMDACRSAGLAFHVSTCAVKGYVDSGELQAIVELARRNGAGGVRIALPMCSGNWLDRPEVLLDEREAEKVRLLARDPFVYIVEEETGTFTHCKAVSGGSLYVSPYGDVQPCNFIPISYGNVREEPFELIVRRMSADPRFYGGWRSGVCPMRNGRIVDELKARMDPLCRLVMARGAFKLATGGRCINSCGFCWRDGKECERPLGDLLREIDSRPEGSTELVLFGGEPCLRSDLKDLIKYARSQRLQVVLHTSARSFALRKDLALELVASGLTCAEVAIFEWDPQSQDRITGSSGVLHEQLKGIRALVEAGAEVRVTLFDPDGKRVRRAGNYLKAVGVQMVMTGRFTKGSKSQVASGCFEGAGSPSVTRRIIWSNRWVDEGSAAQKGPDVLLFFPDCESPDPTLQLPMSLLHLAAPLVKEGYGVKIVDQRISPGWKDELTESILAGVLCVGISCFISRQVANAVEAARHVRGLQGDLPIVWGGVHPTLLARQTLESPFCDAVVRGEGEETFPEYLKCLKGHGDPRGVAGLSFKTKGGEIVENKDRPFLDMDGLPPIPYELVDIFKYERRGLLWALYTSRGCPHRCAFCALSKINGRRWRAQSPRRVVDEIKRIIGLGGRQINICEDNFFVNQGRVREIAKLIVAERLTFEWTASMRVSDAVRMEPALLRLLFKAGLRHVHMGAESGSDRVLKMIDKKSSVGDTLAANLKLKAHGIIPEYIFMMGFPTETERERKQTLNLMRRLKKENPEAWFWRLNRYVPYPGTPLYETACKLGFSPPADLEGWSEMGWVSEQYSDLMDYQVGF